MTKAQRKKQLDSLKAIRGIDRARHFKNGGTLVDWKGGPHTVRVDRKKQQNKTACRGKVRV